MIDPNGKSYPELTTLRERLDAVSRPDVNRYLDAGAITNGLFGSATSANVLTLGVAVQSGALPLSPESVERAIELNGVAVKQNIAAFRFGRQWAGDPAVVEAIAGIQAPRVESIDQMIARLAADLVDYQDEAYSDRYRQQIEKVRQAERSVDPSSTVLTDAVARNLYKLMAYKDEYEVARLALLDESQERYRAIGGKHTKVTYHLHPPALRSMGMDKKIKFRKLGAPSFQALRAMKRVRGTKVDPFGYAKVRRVERAMIPEYERAVNEMSSRLSYDNVTAAASIAALPDQVRGYEHIKLRRAEAYRAELASRMQSFGGQPRSSTVAG